jgi:Ferritin-like
MAGAPPEWTLADLREHLQAAVELELLVIPPYLCALYSLQPGSNEQASLIIRSVVVEEMLHMILAANVLNAVGGKPVLKGSEFTPRYPTKLPYHQGELEVGLRPFGDAALDTFLAIENPSYPLGKPTRASRRASTPRLMTLRPEGYRTVGAFYYAIADGLRELVGRLGERAVFTGERARQVGPEQYYASGGEAIRVDDLSTALAAITEVVEQGEGEVTLPRAGEKFDPDKDLAHYYRFNELRQRRRYRVDDTPKKPTGASIALDLAKVYPMKPNLRTADLPTRGLRQAATAFNVIWSRLLGQLEGALNGSPDELSRAVGTMFELKYAAVALLRIPLPGDEARSHAGPTFEVV